MPPDLILIDTDPDKILVLSITDGDTSCPTPSLRRSGQNGQRNPKAFCSRRVRKRKSFSSSFVSSYSISMVFCTESANGSSYYLFKPTSSAPELEIHQLSYVKPLPVPFSTMVGTIIFPFYAAIIWALKRLSDLTKGTQLVNGNSGV